MKDIKTIFTKYSHDFEDNPIPANAIEEVLDSFGLDLANDLKDSLRKKDILKGGGQDTNLANSIKPITTVKGESVTLNVIIDAKTKEGKYYWRYVDEGRSSGKRPPISALEGWIRSKGLDPRIFTGKVRTGKRKDTIKSEITQAAFVLSKAIGKRGTIKRFGYKGSNFVDPVVNDGRIDKLKQDLAYLIKEGIKINIKYTE